METVYDILLNLDGIIYSFINFLFKIFLLLSRAQIFSESNIIPFIRRIYTIIGVVMLFLLSYALLKAIVNPDTAKDKQSPGKIVFNVIKVIVLLALVPTAFSFAFEIQNSILEANTVGKIIMGTEDDCKGGNCDYSKTISNGGMEMAMGVFEAFIFPTNEQKSEDEIIIANDVSFKEAKQLIKDNENFSVLDRFSEKIKDKELTYYWFISTIAGIFVVYMLVSYCLSLGLRVVKLAFYEIMAPVCIIASVLPSKKEMLSKWIKATVTTFLEVFIRIAILYFAVYIIKTVSIQFESGNLFDFGSIQGSVGSVVKGLAKSMIIMGIVAFVKQGPQLIADITGLDSKNMGLGIKDQLAAGGFFTAGAMAGGLLTAGARNFVGGAARGVNRYKEAKKNAGDDFKGLRKARAFASSFAYGAGNAVTRGVAGGVSGGVRSFNKDAKGFGDMKNSAHKGATAAGAKASYRAGYKDSHGGTIRGALAGHLTDAGEFGKDWILGGSEKYDKAVQEANGIVTAQEAAVSEAESAMKKLDNAHMVATMSSRDAAGNLVNNLFKGANKDKLAAALEGFAGMSLESIRLAVEAEKQVSDFSSAADSIKLSDYASVDDYNRARESAIQTASNAHAERVKILDQMYTQVKDKSVIEFMNAAASGDYSRLSALGIDSDNVSKVSSTVSKIEDVERLYKAAGGTVSYSKDIVGPDGKIVKQTESLGAIDMRNAGKSLDDLKSAFKAVASENLVKANEAKARAEARKKDK